MKIIAIGNFQREEIGASARLKTVTFPEWEKVNTLVRSGRAKGRKGSVDE